MFCSILVTTSSGSGCALR